MLREKINANNNCLIQIDSFIEKKNSTERNVEESISIDVTIIDTTICISINTVCSLENQKDQKNII